RWRLLGLEGLREIQRLGRPAGERGGQRGGPGGVRSAAGGQGRLQFLAIEIADEGVVERLLREEGADEVVDAGGAGGGSRLRVQPAAGLDVACRKRGA